MEDGSAAEMQTARPHQAEGARTHARTHAHTHTHTHPRARARKHKRTHARTHANTKHTHTHHNNTCIHWDRLKGRPRQSVLISKRATMTTRNHRCTHINAPMHANPHACARVCARGHTHTRAWRWLGQTSRFVDASSPPH